jgi:hypothetical protein
MRSCLLMTRSGHRITIDFPGKPSVDILGGAGGRGMRWFTVILIVPIILMAKHHECLAEATFAFAQRSDGHLAWGASWHQPTMKAASTDALESCERSGGLGRCSVVDNFHNKCAALAMTNGSNAYSYYTALEQKVAEDSALVECRKMGGKCHIAISFCDHTAEKTIVCAKPVFPELHELKEMIRREPSKVEFATQATIYLLNKYCTTVDFDPFEDVSKLGHSVIPNFDMKKITQFCNMISDITDVAEPIYWESCIRAE